jgi:hypothetical protein
MTGRCLCGAVTFSVDHAELGYHACHCGMCRRWAGGGALFSVACRGVVFAAGAPVTRYASSSWAERGFCGTCGTVLFYFLKPAATYMMSPGVFDEDPGFHIHREIFIDKKPAGYAFTGDHERWTEEETFARLTPP